VCVCVYQKTGKLRHLHTWGTWAQMAESWAGRSQILYIYQDTASTSSPRELSHTTTRPSPWSRLPSVLINSGYPRGVAPGLGRGQKPGPGQSLFCKIKGKSCFCPQPQAALSSRPVVPKLECLSESPFKLKIPEPHPICNVWGGDLEMCILTSFSVDSVFDANH
jgi:hypothetical protein